MNSESPSTFMNSAATKRTVSQRDDDYDSDMEDGRKPYGRRKIKIEFIEDKSRRHITFSKRKAGIMKKAYELSTLTGTQVLLLVASETGHVYTFATPKLSSIITEPAGKNLIKQCLNADDDPFETESSSSGNGTSRKSKKKYPQKSNDDDDEEENKDNAEEHTNEKENTHINNNASYSNYSHGEAMDGMGNSVNSYYIQNPNMAYNPYISHYWPYAQAAHMNQQFSGEKRSQQLQNNIENSESIEQYTLTEENITNLH